MENQKIWDEFLKQINDKVMSVTYQTWFKPLVLLTITDKEIVIADPGKVYKDQLINFYKDLIEDIFLEITGKSLSLVFIDETKYKEQINIKNNEKPPNYRLDEYIDYDDQDEYKDTNLKDKYTFENFVVGESNRFAFKSALEVAQNPGIKYNPLFLYGKSGLGKTHLMHAIGNYITKHTDLKVLYISAEDFKNDFLRMLKKSDDKEENLSYIELFKSKYRDIDVLMIDEIQFLGNATVTQQEFTNTFNSLYYNEKQIIISSDRSVDDLKLFEDRLKTRFNWGLKAIINIPEYELKIEIIKNKLKYYGYNLNLSNDIIEYMASISGSDVRNLEGMVNRLNAYCAIMGIKSLTLDIAMEALDEFANGRGTFTDNSIGKIMNVVSSYFNLKVDDLTGKKRSKEIANARMIAMYLCRILTEETHARIGLEFGGRDHSTVIHAYDKINEDLKNNSELEKIVSELKVKMSE